MVDKKAYTGVILYQPLDGGPSMMANNIMGVGDVSFEKPASIDDVYRICCDIKARIEEMRLINSWEQVVDMREKLKKGGSIIKPGDINGEN